MEKLINKFEKSIRSHCDINDDYNIDEESKLSAKECTNISQDIAIKFHDWSYKNGYILQDNNKYFKETQKDLSIDYTTEELFKIFINEHYEQ